MRVQPVLCVLLAALWTPARPQIRWKREGDNPLTSEKRQPPNIPNRDPPLPVNNRDRPPPIQPDLQQQQELGKQPLLRPQSVVDVPAKDLYVQQNAQVKAGPVPSKDSDTFRAVAGVNAEPPPQQNFDQGRGAGGDKLFKVGSGKRGQQQHMESAMRQRADEERNAQQQVFQQQEASRQQAQERARQQQDVIRRQMEQQQQLNQQQQKPLDVANTSAGKNPSNNFNNRNLNVNLSGDNRNVNANFNRDNRNVNPSVNGGANGLNANVNGDSVNFPAVKSETLVVPTPKPRPRPTPRTNVGVLGNDGRLPVGGAGSVVGRVGAFQQQPQDSGNRFQGQGSEQGHRAGVEEVPDAPHPIPTIPRLNSNSNNGNSNNQDNIPKPNGQNLANNNEPVNPGLSDEFRRGLIKKVQGDEQSNLNQVPYQQNVQQNAFPPEQPVREVGGMHINWDWDDFSITFQNYGAAEMKVRRAPHATTGEPWPLPQYYTKKNTILTVDPNFEFVVSGNRTCDIIQQAVERYKVRIVQDAMEDMYDNLQNAEGSIVEEPDAKYGTPLYTNAPVIGKFSLKVRKACTKIPNLQSDESYDLVVKKSAAYLWANEVWGLLRGLETLSQLIWRGPDGKLYVKESIISDYPRFPHRGILLDSSRHFIFKNVILDMMDAMEMNKMNVLHWHIVDDQSFPYQSEVYPELSAKGAYHPTFVYSPMDIREIIEYGRMRGIRILPEFDSPGHTYSWGLSRPELLTQCYSGASQVKGYLGPIDPVRNSTYKFLRTLFDEILHVFKDEFMHLGGDEVPLGCWQSNPDVVKFGEKLSGQSGQSVQDNSQSYFGGPSPSIRLVYEYYVNRLMKDIKDLGKKRENGIKFIMWQEVMNNDLKLPNDTLIQVWMGDMADVSRAISLGYNVLYSTCWYLDHVEYGVKWPKYYQCDPVDGSYGYAIDEKKVKGGEACLWSEYIDNENLLQVTWPRASAVAERLWSSKETRNLDLAGERLSEHRCRMLRRGLSVGQVSGPDYCMKRGVNRRRRARSGPTGQAESGPADSQEDIQFPVRATGNKSTDCSWLMQAGGNVTVLAIVAVIALFLLVTLGRTHGKLYQLRQCRHRTILIVFLGVLFIYVMCYTTIWMHAFEFSGAFSKKKAS